MIKKFFNTPLIIISFIGYIILTLLIFYFSLSSGEESSTQSAFVWSFISSVFNIKGNYESFIRKFFGHFLLFSALAVFASVVYYRASQILFKNNYQKYSIFITLLVGILTAGIAELLQTELFVQGRNASFVDLIIDFLGYLLGYLIFRILKFLYLYIIRNKNIQ